jgi:hypothetical protein
MRQAAASGLIPEDQVLHLHFHDLVRDPMRAVETLYERFGLPLGDDARQRMAACVAALPRGGYGGLRHALADYGLDAATERARFADYLAQFGVERGGA